MHKGSPLGCPCFIRILNKNDEFVEFGIFIENPYNVLVAALRPAKNPTAL